MRKLTILMALGGLVAFGCSNKNMEKESTAQVLKEAAEDKYDPPADKKITEKQMQMYLAVHKRELEIAKSAASRFEAKSREEKPGLAESLRTLSDVGKFLTADLRAAKELGYNTAEYQWVKSQVLEASVSAMAEGFQQASTQAVEQSMRYYKEQLSKAQTAEEKQMWQQNIEALTKQQADMQRNTEVPDWVRHNLQIIAKYQGELDAVKSEITKYTNENETEKK
ncbi:MAG: hypothetical protein HY644_06815 [Acidobacteria bacterium]|nr:hypothetical protein [Acidobacteriota bacterium]